MKVCFVSPEYVTEPSYSGGLANYLGRVSVALVERGHEVHVLTRAKENGKIDYRGVTVHRVVPLWDKHFFFDHIDPLVPRVYYNLYQDFKAAWCLWRRWKQISKGQKFDLVQVANVSACGLFFFKEKRVPVVTRLSSYRPVWDTAAGIKETKGVRARWKMEKRAIKGTRWIYAPSHYVAALAKKAYQINVEVVETPFFAEEPDIDSSIYEAQCQGLNYALFFGRMTQMKGLHILADAIAPVLTACPELRMVFVGPDASAPGGGGMQEFIKSRVRTANDGENLLQRVHFLGSLRHDKLYPIIEGARFIVLPSLMDNLPNTCLEAMGAGKVVLATTGSCFEQLITNEQSGFLVPPGDVSALADSMKKIVQLSDEAQIEIGAHARARIAQLHPDITIPELLAYYARVQQAARQRNV